MNLIFRLFLSLLLINPRFAYAQRNKDSIDQPVVSSNIAPMSDIPQFSENEFINAIKSENIPKDMFHLVGQILYFKNKSIPLYKLGDSPLNIQIDDLKFEIEGNNFSIIGMKQNKEVARHTFIDIGIHTFQFDSELLIAATKEGQIHAIDMVYLKKNVFKGPIPVYKDLVSNSMFKSPFSMNFWTRGLSPNLVSGLSEDPSFIFPHNRNGKIFFQAGDLVFHRNKNNDSKAFSIISREVLLKRIVERSEELLVKSSLVSTDIIEQMDPKLISKLSDSFNQKEMTIDDLSHSALSSIPSQSLKSLNEQVQKISDSKKLFDKATYEEWKNSRSILENTLTKSGKTLEPNQDLSSVWQDLMMSHFKEQRPEGIKPSFIKKYGLVLAGLAGVATVTSLLYLNDVKPVLLAIDYLYQYAVPPILKIAEFRFPLLASVTSLISIIPLAQIIAWMSPYMMKSMSYSMKFINKDISEKLLLMAERWQALSVWERIVTMGARVQSGITISFWNHISSILRQPQLFRTLKYGLNPFTKIKANDSIGEKLKLEKDLNLGINNPFLSKEAFDTNTLRQQEALQVLSQNNIQARYTAFQLVALLLYEKGDIDPATLMQLLQGDVDARKKQISDFSNLSNEQKNEWIALTEIISKDWIHTLRNKGKLFEQISSEEFAIIFKDATQKIKSFTNSSVLKRRLLVFKDQANKYLKKSGQNILLLGVEDGRFLGNVYANPFVSEQVRKVFVSDHLITALYPAFWGERANPQNASLPGGAADGTDRNLLTFRPHDGSISNLWTNPEHMMDIWSNVAGHFIGGASRYILLYQKEPPTEETNYQPLENIRMNQTHEKEGFIKGTSQWMLNVADTRKSALGDFYIKTLKKQISTIQAGLILGVAFRMVTLNPTIEFAVMSWYLFFAAGMWSYSWPWTIIGQGNQLEEERLKSNANRLQEVQIRLSQALRLGEQDKINLNVEVLKQLYSTDSKRNKNLIETIGVAPDQIQVAEFNGWAAKLLNYSEQIPPFPTRPNPLPSWMATWSGAIGTTMLAISLGVLSLDPTSLTLSVLINETAKTGAIYTAVYFLFGQSGLWSKFLNKIGDYSKKNEMKNSNILNSTGSLTCRNVFNH